MSFQQRLQQLLTALQLDDAPAGGAVVVYRAGRCIAQASVGTATPDTPWQPDTLALNFSTGKGVLATLAHVLVSQQLLEYDTPIAHYWPAFAAQGKGDITLRHVMSHQANLFSIQSIDADSAALLDWALMLAKVAAMPVMAPTDSSSYGSAYSALVYGWVLGGVIEAVTKLSLAEALRQYLTEPLGIADSCYFGVPDNQVEQVAMLVKDFTAADTDTVSLRGKRHKPTLKADSQRTLTAYAQLPSHRCWQQAVSKVSNNAAIKSERNDSSDKGSLPVLGTARLDTARINRLYFDTSQLNLQNYKAALMPVGKAPIDYYRHETLQAVIPAANGVASAQALAVIYAMLVNGGEWQGQTLIDSTTFKQLSTPQVDKLDAVMPANMTWRLGYHRLFSMYQCEDNQCEDDQDKSDQDKDGPDQAISFNDSNGFNNQGFGHMGYNGSVAWCDPSRQLSFAFVHNFDTTMLNDVRQFALTEAVLSLVDETFL